MSELPEVYQGAGPVFAAVPLGGPWYDLAVKGATTYVVEVPYAAPERPDGWAFLDRHQAETAADAVADGEFTRYEGLSGWSEQTPAREEAERQALADFELRADLASEAEQERARLMTDAEWEATYGPEAGQ